MTLITDENMTKMQSSSVPPRFVMIMIFIVPFLMGIGIDLYVPSFPHIASYFQVSSGLVQLTVAFYVIANGMGQLILGVISDSLGRKKILLMSSLFYTIVSFLAVFSPNIYFLIFCRFLQGLGISGLAAVSRAVAADCFSGKDLAKAMIYMSIGWALGPLIGPVIGSYLQHYFDWQANFYFFSFYGLIIFIYMYALLPETHFKRSSIQLKEMCCGIKKVIFHPIFFFGILLLSLIYSVLILFNLIGPFLIQNVLHFSVVAYGKVALFLGGGYLLGNLFNRLLIHHFEPTDIAVFGLIGGTLISALMVILSITNSMNLYIIIIPVFLLLFMSALIFPHIQAKCFSLFSFQLAGTASAVYGFLLASGGFLLTLFVTTLPLNSQKPMALVYLGLFSLSILMYLMMHHFDSEVG